mmetsp:Transcript_63301/g.181596  ORF Transcript_63301/g.181596 Transcript_63301/m.181596 type:complete len:746 (-) Transcript_63301:60-2297(-)
MVFNLFWVGVLRAALLQKTAVAVAALTPAHDVRSLPLREILSGRSQTKHRQQHALLELGSKQRSSERLWSRSKRRAQIVGGPLFEVNVTYEQKENSSWHSATLSMDATSNSLNAEAGINPSSGIAWAHFVDKLDTIGWTELTVETTDSARVSNTMRMYGAGYVEGLLTATRMSQFYSNLWQGLSKDAEGSAALVNIQNVFRNMLVHLKEKTHLNKGVASPEPVDHYWKHVRYLFAQLWGINDGYNAMAKRAGVRKLELLDLLIINSHAVLPELMEAFTPKATERRHKFQTRSGAGMGKSSTLLQRGARGRHLAVKTFAGQARGEGLGSPRGSINDDDRRRHAPVHAQEEGKEEDQKVQEGQEVGEKMLLHDAGLRNMSGSKSEHRQDLLAMADRDWEQRLARHGHCSALVRLTPESRDLLVGHSTWSDYSRMTRVFKYYTFSLPNSGSATKVMGFSSYPGCVGSTDNFYMMDSGIVAVDTSLEVLNVKVYDRISDFRASPYTPNFMHVVIVNRLAHTATDWTTLFARQGTGFPSAQWMVVDYNKFTPGMSIPENTLRLLEQVPGLIRHDDISQTLRDNRYWASYNRPYFAEIRQASGHTAAENSFGALYSFGSSPRALIFKHLAGSVTDLFSMRHIMRRNAYPNENVLPNEPGHAISARLDLDVLRHIPNGGVDSKVVNRCLLQSLQCQAVSGPSHDDQPVFKWRNANGGDLFPGWPHLGLPDVWGFGWAQMSPSAMLEKPVDKC